MNLNSPLECAVKAEQLMAQGYYRISYKFRLAARVDRSDWEEYLQKEYHVSHLSGNWYRRCVSKDVIELPWQISKRMRTSSGEKVGFVEKEDV